MLRRMLCLLLLSTSLSVAAEPLRILVVSGLFFNIIHPCAVLLEAQNRLTQEMQILIVRFIVTAAACTVGLQWGLNGVAWAILATHLFSAVYYFRLVARVIPTRPMDLINAAKPAIILNSVLFSVLAAAHTILGALHTSIAAFHLAVMILSGGVSYLAALLFLRIPAIDSEAQRWREKVSYGLRLVLKMRT